jgi:tetratricopeptide (TPR) repeat protein
LDVEPNNLVALSSKVLALDNLGNHHEAITHLDKALAIEPNNLDALHDKGFVLANLEKYEEVYTISYTVPASIYYSYLQVAKQIFNSFQITITIN